jgi:hypothetical protein
MSSPVSAMIARAVAGAGDLDRARGLADQAETAARAITDPYEQARALAELVEVVAGAGDLDRAWELAHAIIDPGRQAKALADLARKATPNQARSLLAQALTAGHWEASLVVLVQVNAAAVSTIADEYSRTTSLYRNSP